MSIVKFSEVIRYFPNTDRSYPKQARTWGAKAYYPAYTLLSSILISNPLKIPDMVRSADDYKRFNLDILDNSTVIAKIIQAVPTRTKPVVWNKKVARRNKK